MTTARRRASTAAMHAVRPVLEARSEGRCDVCNWSLDVSESGYLFEAHHRLSRARGGGDSPANLMVLHPACHQAVHSQVSRSTVNGWILPSGSMPDEVSVSLRGDAALLTADGGVLWIGDAGTAFDDDSYRDVNIDTELGVR